MNDRTKQSQRRSQMRLDLTAEQIAQQKQSRLLQLESLRRMMSDQGRRHLADHGNAEVADGI